jgi:hypothetical protein
MAKPLTSIRRGFAKLLTIENAVGVKNPDVSTFLVFQKIGTQSAYHQLDISKAGIDAGVIVIESQKLSGKLSIIFEQTQVFDDPVGDDFDFDELKRFGQIIESAEPDRFNCSFNGRVARHDDNVAVGISGARRFEDIEAAGTWRHHQIRKNNVELLAGIEKAESFRAAACGGQAESPSLHVLAKCQSEVTVVLNDKEPGLPWEKVRNLDHDGLIGKCVENFRVYLYTKALSGSRRQRWT